ncbi:hypothetical protein ACPXCE_17730 [Streptomyces sp. DT24]|uniref:hypothetical protein n=1 Tax=Streptomyces sp. DT24 TaxID=3416520 RepID=UPI003CF9E483
MDLTPLVRLRRAALRRPAVLVAAGPGATRVRLAVERELPRRGWPTAHGPADADLLVVAGDPGTGHAEWAAGVWDAMGAPRARVAVGAAERVADALDEAHRALLAACRATGGGHPTVERRPQEPGRGSDLTAHRRRSPGAGPQHGRTGHEEHTGHGTSGVAGAAMAERADDRDGLRLDRLHLPLGPVLPDWPAGLVLRLALQGDVIQRAAVETPPPSAHHTRPAYWDEPWLRALRGETVSRGAAARRLCAAHLDSLGRLLAVAGWGDAAARARSVRDAALTDTPAAELPPLVDALARRVRRSRVLRRSTAGLGVLTGARAVAAGATGPALTATEDGHGDVYGRLLAWLAGAERASAESADARPLNGPTARTGPRGALDGPCPPSRALLDLLPALLDGAEFAGARLIVASLDPDLDGLVTSAAGSADGTEVRGG